MKKVTPETIETTEDLMRKYDVDHDGHISKEELVAIVCDLRQGKKEQSRLRMFICLLSLLAVLMCGALFGTSFAAGHALKESHVKQGLLTTLQGNMVKTEV